MNGCLEHGGAEVGLKPLLEAAGPRPKSKCQDDIQSIIIGNREWEWGARSGHATTH